MEMTHRIHQDELAYGKLYNNIWHDDGHYYHNSEAFTGVMFDTVDDIIISETDIVNGVLHGWEKHWNLNGELISAGEFDNGYPCGTHRYWHDGNILYKELVYKNNQLEKETIRPKREE